MTEKNGDSIIGVQDSADSEDMMDTSQELAIDSMEDSSTLPSFDGSRHLATTAATKGDNNLKALSNLPMVSNTSLISPVIIGNVHAANALSSVLNNQEVVSNETKAFLSSASLNSDLISSVIPVFISSSKSLAVSQCNPYSNENSMENLNEEGRCDQVTSETSEIQNQMYNETQNKFVNSNVFDPSRDKPSLSSSDTIILTSDSSCPVKNEISLDVNDKKLSLLPNISERSVSLDSIPSLTLFKPELLSDTEAGIINEESTGGVAVIGSDKFPSWLIQLIKKHNNLVVQGSSNEQSSNNKIISIESLSQLEGKGLCTEELSKASSLNRNKNQEGAIDSSETPEEILGSLNHSDTVILSMDECTTSKKPTDKPGLEAANGLSFSSVSTMSADPSELVDEQNVQGSLISKHIPETPGSLTSFLNGNISQILYPLQTANDSHRFNLVNLSETNSFISRLTSGDVNQNVPQSFGNSPVLVVCNNILSSPRLAEAKETQTDLVLGTNPVYFKAVENIQGGSNFEEGQIPTTLLAMTDSTSASFCDTGQTLHFAQPKLVLPTDPQMPTPFISATSTAALAHHNIEFIASTALNNASQEMAPNPSSSEYSKEKCPYKCVVCDERFSSKDELSSHKKSHKTFKCDLCNATFSRMGNYTRHRKIHNLHAENQSGFQCDECGRKFLQRCDLRRHCLIHTRQEPYRCDICNKGYIRRSDLIVHMRFHNKDRAFNCSLCDKKFFQSGDLNRHVRRAHQPDSQLTCGHCDKKYACETTLIRHMKAVHKDIILQAVNQRMQGQKSTDKASDASAKEFLFTTKQT